MTRCKCAGKPALSSFCGFSVESVSLQLAAVSHYLARKFVTLSIQSPFHRPLKERKKSNKISEASLSKQTTIQPKERVNDLKIMCALIEIYISYGNSPLSVFHFIFLLYTATNVLHQSRQIVCGVSLRISLSLENVSA